MHTRALLLLPLLLVPHVARSATLQVPGQFANLQDAINAAVEGDVIEIAAGTYPAAAAPQMHFRIVDKGEAFTLRAAPGAEVILDGGGTTDILRLINPSAAQGRPVVFEGLTFANGYSDSDAIGGVTLNDANASFIGCTFRDFSTGTSLTNSSGAVHVIDDSTVFFEDSLWQDNSSKNAGAALVIQNSTAWIHNSRFLNNRTNLPNHRTTAAGGAIHAGATATAGNHSDVRLSNTRFEGSRAGYTGGAIFIIGEFLDPVDLPLTEVEIANCTFIDNRAERDPSVTFNAPTEGGAVHAENQSRVRIFNSRFITNVSDLGGAVSLYRSAAEVHDSVFLGNQAVDQASGKPFGGAFKASSNDTNNATTGNGAFNRPSARLTVNHSLIQGRYGSVTTVSESAGGISALGDNNRTYGLGGVNVMGTPEENRATLFVDGTVFSDLDVEATTTPRSGRGGGIAVNLADVTVLDSLFIDSDTLGPGNFPQGGGLLSIGDSSVAIDGSTFANNTASQGAAMEILGAELSLSNSQFFANEIPAGYNQSLGSAIYSAPYVASNPVLALDVTGNLTSCILSNNVGLPIFEADGDTGPINDVVYNQNQIYSTSSGDNVYFNSLIFLAADVPTLNTLTVVRSGAPDTDKSTVSNVQLGSPPSLGELKAVPRKIIPATAAGDTETETVAYLGYAWNGGSASLDGQTLGSGTGLVANAFPGSHTLSVDGNELTAEVIDAPAPSATFTASPALIGPGGSSTLSWSVDAGTLIEVAIDQGVEVVSAATGSIVVSPEATTTYRLFVLTEEGGTVKSVTVQIGENSLIFADGFESGNTSAWSF